MKIFKIIIINIFLMLSIFLIVEAITYYYVMQQTKYDTGFSKVLPRYNKKFFDWDENYPYVVKFNFRKPYRINSLKKPIVIFGCSYAYGYKLENHQTFGFKLAKYTKRPVYNRAYSGLGIQHMLYQLRRDDFYKEVPEPEYVIFVYINNHIPRLYYKKFDWFTSEYLHYVNKGDDLVRWHKEYAIIYNLYSVEKISKFLVNIRCKSTQPFADFPFVVKHFEKSKEAMEKHWKNTKFVILNYDDIANEKSLNKLKDSGFIVVNLYNLEPKLNDSKDFRLAKNDSHPSEKAWDVLVPKIVDKLKL